MCTALATRQVNRMTQYFDVILTPLVVFWTNSVMYPFRYAIATNWFGRKLAVDRSPPFLKKFFEPAARGKISCRATSSGDISEVLFKCYISPSFCSTERSNPAYSVGHVHMEPFDFIRDIPQNNLAICVERKDILRNLELLSDDFCKVDGQHWGA